MSWGFFAFSKGEYSAMLSMICTDLNHFILFTDDINVVLDHSNDSSAEELLALLGMSELWQHVS